MIQPMPPADLPYQAQHLLNRVRKGDLLAISEFEALLRSAPSNKLFSTDKGILRLTHLLMLTDLNLSDVALIQEMAERFPIDTLFADQPKLLGNLGAVAGAARAAFHFKSQTNPPATLTALDHQLTRELAAEINQRVLPRLSQQNEKICELAIHLFEVHKILEHQLDKLEKEQLNAPENDSLTAKIRLIRHAILITEAITDTKKREAIEVQALTEQLTEDIKTLDLKLPPIEQSFGELVWAVFQAIYFLFDEEARQQHELSETFEAYKRTYNVLQTQMDSSIASDIHEDTTPSQKPKGAV